MISTNLSSQIITDFPAITTPNTNDKPVEIKRLNISVFVVENIATTTFEMQFYNNNDRVMEGELNFPLANGVTVSRFALDVNGEMREGVVVEKEKGGYKKATIAFEQELTGDEENFIYQLPVNFKHKLEDFSTGI